MPIICPFISILIWQCIFTVFILILQDPNLSLINHLLRYEQHMGKTLYQIINWPMP